MLRARYIRTINVQKLFNNTDDLWPECAILRVMNATLVIRNYNVETLVLAEELRIYAPHITKRVARILFYISSDNICMNLYVNVREGGRD